MMSFKILLLGMVAALFLFINPSSSLPQNEVVRDAFADAARAGADYEQANAFAVVDFAGGRVLASKNLEKRLPVASLTKLMTAVVSLDLAEPDELFTISRDAVGQVPTKLAMVEGQKMELRELLYGALLTSANDAAEVIREGIDEKYGGDVFVRAMNEKAKNLGLKDTSFSNPQGFDNPQNHSTASDLAVLTHYALSNYPLIAEIVTDDYEFLPEDQNHKQHDLYNWNGLLNVYPGVKGVKIGNTGKAGYTTIIQAERKNRQALVVLLGAPGVLERDLWAAELLDVGFEKLGVAPANISKKQLKNKYSTWKFFR